MKLVDDSLLPSAAKPRIILPIESMGIDHFTGTVYIPGLKPGSRIRNFLCTINSKAIEAPWLRCIGHNFKPTLVAAFKRQTLDLPNIFKTKLGAMRRGSPQTKTRASIVTTFRTKRHAMTSLHSTLLSF